MATHTTQAQRLARGSVISWAGTTQVLASAAGVREVHLPEWREGTQPGKQRKASYFAEIMDDMAAMRHLSQTLRELAEYFDGERQQFTVALDPQGPTFFQQAWRTVAAVSYGETRSYGEIARELSAPAATRAVGAANGANPVAPLVPCHRIVGSNGSLTGYGPGLPLKRLLLAMEGAIPATAAEYEAWVERVASRYGGSLLLGVRPTHTYCRPTCEIARRYHDAPARFFASPAEAEAAGFRACGRCSLGQLSFA
ncbi:MAG: Methylated-DNA--protein-cysteine methyltransferase [Ktedonobacterales bacterium]|nr:MAG: Methylated-DNA--protein-cysteine methyltransferase [Ktedonobacterales bacterium]